MSFGCSVRDVQDSLETHGSYDNLTEDVGFANLHTLLPTSSIDICWSSDMWPSLLATQVRLSLPCQRSLDFHVPCFRDCPVPVWQSEVILQKYLMSGHALRDFHGEHLFSRFPRLTACYPQAVGYSSWQRSSWSCGRLVLSKCPVTRQSFTLTAAR